MNTYLQVNVDGVMFARVEFVDQPREPNLEFADALRNPDNRSLFGSEVSRNLRQMFTNMVPRATFHVYRAMHP